MYYTYNTFDSVQISFFLLATEWKHFYLIHRMFGKFLLLGKTILPVYSQYQKQWLSTKSSFDTPPFQVEIRVGAEGESHGCQCRPQYGVRSHKP